MTGGAAPGFVVPPEVHEKDIPLLVGTVPGVVVPPEVHEEGPPTAVKVAAGVAGVTVTVVLAVGLTDNLDRESVIDDKSIGEFGLECAAVFLLGTWSVLELESIARLSPTLKMAHNN